MTIIENRLSPSPFEIVEILPNTFDRIEKQCADRDNLLGIDTGFSDLNAYTSGFQKSDLIVLASRPSMGKSSLCRNIVSHIALQQIPVLLFSLETNKEQLTFQIVSSNAEVDTQRIRIGELSQDDFSRLHQAMGKLGDSPLYIEDTSNLTIQDIESKSEEWAIRTKQTNDIGFIAIDYLQLIRSRNENHESRSLEIAEITRRLKLLARKLDVPILLLSQISQKPEGRTNKKPILTDLSEASSIIQDADLVLFIYRDEYYNKESERPGTADIIIAKQRNGPVGDIELLFRHSITRFMNPADLMDACLRRQDE